MEDLQNDDTTCIETEPNESDELKNIKKEIQSMREQDERQEQLFKDRYQRDVRREKLRIEEKNLTKGIHCNPGVKEVKAAIQEINKSERKFALQRKLDELDRETDNIRKRINDKYGVLFSKDKEKTNFQELADNFFNLPGNSHLPKEVTDSLTHREIMDLQEVFDLFDVQGKGYINVNDLKRLVSMLGFRAPKEVLHGMIAELAGENKSKVSFTNFLQFVVQSQGEGPDPFEDIRQAFELIDVHHKGFLTISDLRSASEDCKLSFSNRVLREMIEEADRSGDGKITLQEFTSIMLQTSMFKMAS